MKRRMRQGFTLIRVMIVVRSSYSAAIAIPMYQDYEAGQSR